MVITSTAFKDRQPIPQKYSMEGENIHPPLAFSDIPDGTKSLALIVDDPDAPMGIWIHWIAWNMPPNTTEIAEGVVPEGREGITSSGQAGYSGPYPPSGTHRYFFKVYALDQLLELPESSNKLALESAMQGHILASTQLIGIYTRQ